MRRRLFLLFVMALFCLSTMTIYADEGTVNVALYQPATASSFVDDAHSAELANDGINDNETYTWWMNKSDDVSVWWQVDLGISHKICSVEVAPRVGGSAIERKNFRILASNNADFSQSVELAVVTEDYGELFSVEVNKKDKFRFVRIEKTDTAALSLGELRVLVKKAEIAQGAEAVSLTGQIPSTDEAGRYILPADVIGTPYEKAVQLLSALNLMRGYPDGDFLPYDSITRAEFSTVIARMLGGELSAGTRSFIDVKPEHWAYNAIETVAGMGIVNGIDKGLFAPDSKVTKSQVIKMLVSALGYSDVAERTGGYPEGYQKMASKLGLYDDITLQQGENINRGEIALLVYNALECDIMQVMGTGKYITGTAYKGQTVLTEYLHLNKAKGIVTGVRGSSLTNVNHRESDDYLEINGTQYVSSIPGLDRYLGYEVEYYYDNNLADIPKVAALVVTNRNTSLTIDASELLSIKNNTLLYGMEKEQKARLSENMDVIYNGVALRIYDYEELLPSSGQVTLIDNNGDLAYDVYIVLDIKNYIVNFVNLNKNTVYTKDAAGSLPLDMEKSNVSITHKATGAPVTLETLQEWNVLSVMESVNTEGQKCYQVIVSDEFVRGQLEEKGYDYLIIAGRKFGIADNFDVSSVELGAKGFYYLDAVGKVAAFNGDSTPGACYGFLRGVNYPNEGLDRKLQFRVFTHKGIFETLTASDKFTLNGALVTDKSTVKGQLEATGMAGTAGQAIYYTINASGLVTSMETTNGALVLNYDPANGIGTPPIASDMAGYYLSVAETFDSAFAYDEDTVMVELPPGNELASEKGYALLTSSDLKKSNYYKVMAYDVSDEKIAKMLVFTGGASSDAGDSEKLFLVNDLKQAVNDEEGVSYKVSGLYGGEEVEYFINEDASISVNDFTQGTVMTLAFKGSEISDYEIKFFPTVKPNNAPEYSISSAASECQAARNVRGILGGGFMGYGTVTAKKNGIMIVTFSGTTGEEGTSYPHLVVRLSSLENIYRYDSENKKIMLGKDTDVLDEATVGTLEASRVIVTADSGLFRECIILD